MSYSGNKLERSLGPVMLWGLGVGYVISGMYFGWNLGLPSGGTLGLGISTLFITLMYVFFTFSYCELACAIPQAGGAFAYAHRAFGRDVGFVTGLAQFLEFVFAPPAIAYAIGAYFHEFIPGISILTIALLAFAVFTLLNIWGVKAAARFELFITIFAVLELFIFAAVTLPHFEVREFILNPLPKGVGGVFASIPFAVWFFLGIEGVANVAEETIDPQVNVVKGFGSAMATLVLLCGLTFMSAIGVAGWERIVYPTPGSLVTSDSPLPLALSVVVGKNNYLYHLLLTIGLFGLVASFHGLILAAGRVTYEFGRVGYFPRKLGEAHRHFHTPAWALIFNTAVGILALLTGKTSEIITIACFGALTLYVLSLGAFFSLRRQAPEMPRPFRAPFYPWAQALALGIALVALVSMAWFHPTLAALYFGLLSLGFIGFKIFVPLQKVAHETK